MVEETFNRVFTRKDKYDDIYAEPATAAELAEVLDSLMDVPGDLVSLCFGKETEHETPLGGKVAEYEHNVTVVRGETEWDFFDEEGEDDKPTVYPTAKDGVDKFEVGGKPVASYVPHVRVYPPMDDL